MVVVVMVVMGRVVMWLVWAMWLWCHHQAHVSFTCSKSKDCTACNGSTRARTSDDCNFDQFKMCARRHPVT